MILLALFALALVGTTVTLLARASALPRVRAARRLDEIAAYGACRQLTSAARRRAVHVVLEGVASRLGAVVGAPGRRARG